MSDRGIPRSYRTMEGFGIHTFRHRSMHKESDLCPFPRTGNRWRVNTRWCGMKVTKLTGRDPDFHRRDLWEAIPKRAISGIRAGPATHCRRGLI